MSRIITRRTAVAGLAVASSLPMRRTHADLAAIEDAARKVRSASPPCV